MQMYARNKTIYKVFNYHLATLQERLEMLNDVDYCIISSTCKYQKGIDWQTSNELLELIKAPHYLLKLQLSNGMYEIRACTKAYFEKVYEFIDA